MTVIIVGEAPSRPDAEAFSASSSRDRLKQLLQVSDEQLDKYYHCVNLCSDSWNPEEAREAAYALVTLAKHHSKFLLCGRKVQKTFQDSVLRKMDATSFPSNKLFVYGDQCFTYVCIPHPSGRNRFWNDPENIERTQAFLRKALR